jgi:hypothetical protein
MGPIYQFHIFIFSLHASLALPHAESHGELRSPTGSSNALLPGCHAPGSVGTGRCWVAWPAACLPCTHGPTLPPSACVGTSHCASPPICPIQQAMSHPPSSNAATTRPDDGNMSSPRTCEGRARDLRAEGR